MGGGLNLRKGEKLKQKIIIYNANENIENEELRDCPMVQNESLKEEDFNIDFRMKARNGINAIFSLLPDLFHKIIKYDKVKWTRNNVKEFLKPLRCFKCWSFGYLAKYYQIKLNCINCYS